VNNNKPDLSPFCMRARSFMSQGRVDDAIGLYEDVIKVDPANSMAYADRGTAYAMLKKFDLALEDLKRAITLGSIDASVRATIATVYFEQKKLQEALFFFAEAIELDSGYPLTYYNRSNVFHELGDNDSAIADLEKCLRFNSEEDFRVLVLKRLDFLQSQRGKSTR
jgi:tetratricopeptide (TPR) repeat protein